jgi:hypothetical protein
MSSERSITLGARSPRTRVPMLFEEVEEEKLRLKVHGKLSGSTCTEATGKGTMPLPRKRESK